MDGRQDIVQKISLFIILIVMLMAGASGAVPNFMSTGNPTDTASGTVLVARATLETVNFYDLNGTQMPTSEGLADESSTVLSEYGLSGPGHLDKVFVKPGETIYHYYMVTNEANNLDMPNLYHTFSYYGGASNWLVELYHDGGFRATLETGVTYTFQPLISDNSDTSLYYKVQIAPSASLAPSGSGITITTSFETPTSTPVGQYTGGNYFTYGGNYSSSEGVTEEVQAPNIILTRTSTVDAPLTFTGGIHDNVPGSVITYQMTYSNTGSVPAENCILIDKIPTYANLAHFNTTGTTTNVAITMAAGTATGWVIRYSILDTPNTDYGDTADWRTPSSGDLIGTLPTAYPGGSTTYPNGSGVVPFNAKWVKWEKASVSSSEDDVTITWGVTVR